MEDATGAPLLIKDHNGRVPAPCHAQPCPGAISKVDEVKHPERPLSPVLNNSTKYRKIMFDRRRDRSKSRVKLVKRFAEQQKNQDEGHITRLFSDLQAMDGDNPDNRLKKIEEFECEKRKFSDCLYEQKSLKTDKNCESQLSSSDDFNFKKPLSPFSSFKRAKPCTDVLLQDRKYNRASDLNNLNNHHGKEKPCKIGNSQINDSNHIGFCTGAGKRIVVSPESLKKQSEIFSDILSASETDTNEYQRKLNLNTHCNLLCQIESEKGEFSKLLGQTESFLGEFHSPCHNQTTELHPKDVLFVHPSISDSQLILAADIAMSVMDVPNNDDWIAPASPTSSDFEEQISELNDVIGQENEDFLPDENSAQNSTLEHEMKELEKVLNGEVMTEMLDSGDNLAEKVSVSNELAENASKGDEISNGQPSSCNENDECKGFQICEQNQAHYLVCKYNQLITYISQTVSNKHTSCALVESESKRYKIDRSETEVMNSKTEISSKIHGKCRTRNSLEKKKGCDAIRRLRRSTSLNTSKSEDIFPIQSLTSTSSMEFLTAGGKSIAISEEARGKGKKLFIDEDVAPFTKSMRRVVNEDLVSNKFEVEKSEFSAFQLNSTAGTLQPQRFSTAGGRSIHVAVEAEVMFTNEDLGANKLEIEQPRFYPPKIIEEKLLDSKTGRIQPGFATASGRSIQISEEAAKKAQTIFTNEDLATNKLEIGKASSRIKEKLQSDSKTGNIQGFAAASGRSTNIPDEAAKKAETIFTSEDLATNKMEMGKPSKRIEEKLQSIIKPGSIQQGFATANGRSIKISEEAAKKSQTIFTNVDLATDKMEIEEKLQSDSKTGNIHVGFATAGGQSIKISDEAVKRAKSIFTNEDLATNKLDIEKPSTRIQENLQPDLKPRNIQRGFATAGGRSIKITKEAARRAETIFTNEDLASNKLEIGKPPIRIEERHQSDLKPGTIQAGFATAGGQKIKISDEAAKKAKSIFTNEDLATNKLEIEKPSKRIEEKLHSNTKPGNIQQGFATADGKTIKISAKAIQKAESLFTDKDLPVIPAKAETHSKTSGLGSSEINPTDETPRIPNHNLQQRNSSLQKEAGVNHLKTIGQKSSSGGFSTAIGKNIQLSNSALQRARSIFGDEDLSACLGGSMTSTGSTLQNSKTSLDAKEVDQKNKSNTTTPKILDSADAYQSPARFRSTKKRLGVSFCKQIAVANDKLQKAKLLFQDIDGADQNTSNASVSSPLRPMGPAIYSSTPLKETVQLPAKRAHLLADLNVTPIKRLSFVENVCVNVKNEDCPIIFQRATEGDTKSWLESIHKEYENMKRRLEVLVERKMALEVQKNLIENDDGAYRRPTMGVLLDRKQTAKKISLKQFVKDQKPGDGASGNVPRHLLEITPQNAEQMHFNCKWRENSDEQCAVFRTADGAVLIPNTNDLLGLAEVQASFEAMPGVDRKLLPYGWIRNHFKWIVWKLASLERSFPDVFKECLSLENVMQQLKYRYDREIDRAERSALRRITEKDDVSQKRMILCVSDIIKVADMCELELTDGWYSIRTVIDALLCRQVITSKIVIGTKLIIQCAEIINCEGCHPLEVLNSVRLKINYNCTRRAAWHSKLGYQRVAEPFPTPLGTLHPDGGTVGCIKVVIARVYPLKYMERQGGIIVWRNSKAEEKRAQEWENQRTKELEILKQKILAEYEKGLIGAQKNNMVEKVDLAKIAEITSPNLLYQLLENSNDPDSFRSKLSSSQFESAMEYKRNIFAKQQQELSTKIADGAKKLQSLQRDVTPVLKLQVIDASVDSDYGFILNIWRPTEDHLQTLKEGSAFTVYNISPRFNGELASTGRTHFKLLSTLPSHKRVERRILPISSVLQMSSKPLFNEYDTVGTAVRIRKNAYYQEVWLTDSAANFLLIKVVQGSERCSLLDNVIKGQGVAIMNLIFCESQDGFAQAIANQTTVITSFPQHRFLQTGLEMHCGQMPKNLTAFLDDCDKKIEVCSARVQSRSRSSASSVMDSASVSTSYSGVFDDSSEDNTLIPSRMTTTDVAMSLIDTDQYFDNA